MVDNRNYFIAITLSMAVLIAWHFLVNVPQIEAQRLADEQRIAAEQAAQQAAGITPVPGVEGIGVPQIAGQPGVAPVPPAQAREAAIAQAPRLEIQTPELSGSLSLRGSRIDDVTLTQYRETVDPESANIELLSPSGAANPYYVEKGWVGAPGSEANLPGPDTVWTLAEGEVLTPTTPITLTHDAGDGLTFVRQVSVDSDFLFTVVDTIQNSGSEAVTVYPYALISRHGRPETINFFVLHEGLIGVLGEEGLITHKYDDVEEDGPFEYDAQSGWLGITDKYWATAIVPEQQKPFKGRFTSAEIGGLRTFQADFLGEATIVSPGATVSVTGRIFAGAKEVRVIDSYEEQFGIDRFELMIDWGWFYFITKPLFWVIDYFFHLLGNFGVAILIVTVLIKMVFFPLANKSYRSLAGMKKVQPEMERIRTRYADDKMKQQQALMELYKKEKINPLSGCLPILIQIPVFFALYKVLFVTIEMRHAPFFGWIQDLSAPDPTSIFNLFGLLPFAVPAFLLIGVWPLLMGITMFIQMRLNPPPPDPTQAMIFNWMPVLFTFLLATFPAGLVIYWTWNNFLSILQQYVIMKRAGADVDIFGNTLAVFGKGAVAQKVKEERKELEAKKAAKEAGTDSTNSSESEKSSDDDAPADEATVADDADEKPAAKPAAKRNTARGTAKRSSSRSGTGKPRRRKT